MKRFIISSIVFLAICFCCIEVFLVPISFAFEQAAYKSKNLDPYCRINFVTECNDTNADLLIIGNSRAKDSYNDVLLSELTGLKCLNLAMAGYPFNFQYHIMYKTYIKHNVTPKYILMEIGPFSFFDYSTPKYTIEMLPYIDREEFQFYYDICPELSYKDHYRIIRYAGKYEEMVSQIMKIKESDSNYKNELQANQVLEDDTVANPKENYEKNYLKKKTFNVEKNPDIIKLFKSFMSECENQKIQVILVCSPIHTTDGTSHFDMEGFWNLITDIIKGHEIKILNYQNLFEDNTTYFANSMHLNSYGKNCFTRKIAHDLDSLNILHHDAQSK